MKSNFFKKLAAGLALAMVVTSVAPTAATVSAATASITLKSGSTTSTVYVTNSYALKLGKNVKATWRTSNRKVATVGLTGGVMKPVAPGKVTITAKSKKTGKVYKKSYTVKLRAKKFTVSKDLVMAVGEKKQLKAVKTPSNSTDVVRFFTDNAKVATVGMTGGVLTAKGNGTATITAYCKATAASSKTSKANLVVKFKVTVGKVITSSVQTTTKKLDVTFNTDMKDAKASDFSITKDETKQNFGIKGITVNGKKVTVETFQDINDGKTYTVTCGSATYQFTATNGKVASLAISPATISYGTATAIKVAKVDSNGVVLGEYKLTDKPSDMEFKVETTQGYTNNEGELTLYAIGNTAKATAIYHTNQYDANGNEVGAIKTELTITAVDKKAITVKDSKYTIATKVPTNWSNVVANTKLAEKDRTKKIFFFMKNSEDKIVKTGYTLDSSNKDVLLVGSTYIDGDAFAADLVAVAQGSAYVLVKNDKGEVVWSLPVSIVSEKKAAGLNVDITSFVLSNAVDSAKVATCELKDQYGDNMSLSLSDTNVECVNVANGSVSKGDVNLSKGTYFTVANNKITFKGKGVAAGVYTYIVEASGFKRTITVQVKQPSQTATAVYQLEISDVKVDAKFDGTANSKAVTVKLAEVKDGVVSGYVNLDAGDVVIKDKDGKAVTLSLSADTATFSVVKINDNKTVTKAAAGNYTVEVKKTVDSKYISLAGGFVVEDTQPGLTCKVAKDTVTLPAGLTTDDAKAKEAAKLAFELTYEGKEVKDIASVEYTKLGNTINFKGITANVTIGDYTVPLTVKVAKTITAN